MKITKTELKSMIQEVIEESSFQEAPNDITKVPSIEKAFLDNGLNVVSIETSESMGQETVTVTVDKRYVFMAELKALEAAVPDFTLDSIEAGDSQIILN
jgi:hypothetical protein